MLTAQPHAQVAIEQLLAAAIPRRNIRAEFHFTNILNFKPLARNVFAFHRPRALADWRPRHRPTPWAPPAPPT